MWVQYVKLICNNTVPTYYLLFFLDSFHFSSFSFFHFVYFHYVVSYVIILQASLLADASQNDDESMMSQASTLISRVNVSSTSHKQVLTAAVRMAMITRTKTSNGGSDDRESSVSHPSAHDNKILSSDDHDTSVTVENKIEVDDVTAADDDSEIDKKADDVTTDDDNEIAENVDDITTDDDSEVAENPNDDTIGLTLPQNASSPSEKDSESSDDSSTDDE